MRRPPKAPSISQGKVNEGTFGVVYKAIRLEDKVKGPIGMYASGGEEHRNDATQSHTKCSSAPGAIITLFCCYWRRYLSH